MLLRVGAEEVVLALSPPGMQHDKEECAKGVDEFRGIDSSLSDPTESLKKRKEKKKKLQLINSAILYLKQ